MIILDWLRTLSTLWMASLCEGLRSDAKEISATIMDPQAPINHGTCPYLRARAQRKNRPAESDTSPEGRVLEPQTLTELNDMVLYHDDHCLAEETCQSSIILERPMDEHGCAAVSNSRDEKPNEELKILRRERAFAKMQNILGDKNAWRGAQPPALLMPNAAPSVSHRNKSS